MAGFILKSPFEPAGDQPAAIDKLVAGLEQGYRQQTLLGVTGSGKTFTMANVIAQVQKPTLVIAHNKTLAAQLAQEYRDFFPENAVHYFVSYYDYYQPEAYIPTTDTYIEKDAKINAEIDRLRHASTQALLTRRDVIIVASVSCIYGLGSPAEYEAENLRLAVGQTIVRADLVKRLVTMHYARTSADLKPGLFRLIGSSLEIFPTGATEVYQILLGPNEIKEILFIDPVSRTLIKQAQETFLFPAKHFITPPAQQKRAIKAIREELDERLKELTATGKTLEAERLRRRTNYDLVMIGETGYTNGVENYSRHLSGRRAGEPPDTLLSYFPRQRDGTADFLTIIDESHVTVPQLLGMYAGDRSRKLNLIDYGFRLPSALDNRPLQFDEFIERVGQIIHTSATPADYEREESSQIVEQIIRPTGLLDPALLVRPITGTPTYNGQIKDFIEEAGKVIKGGGPASPSSQGGRVLATTLTKKMAEDLSEYLKERGFKTTYLHSDVKTLERIKILTSFRQGTFDCLVGVNLLREGLDLPEVEFIGILDADKEGFLRSEVSLIQTIGRAARNVAGRVILYADRLTDSMKRAIDETNRRRSLQFKYNQDHGITPTTIKKNIKDITETLEAERGRALDQLLTLDRTLIGADLKKLLKEKVKQLNAAVAELDFETAALIRDEIKLLQEKE